MLNKITNAGHRERAAHFLHLHDLSHRPELDPPGVAPRDRQLVDMMRRHNLRRVDMQEF